MDLLSISQRWTGTASGEAVFECPGHQGIENLGLGGTEMESIGVNLNIFSGGNGKGVVAREMESVASRKRSQQIII